LADSGKWEGLTVLQTTTVRSWLDCGVNVAGSDDKVLNPYLNVPDLFWRVLDAVIISMHTWTTPDFYPYFIPLRI